MHQVLQRRAGALGELGERSSIAAHDFFVIASGTSDTHVRSMADHVVRQLREEGERPTHAEGVDFLLEGAKDAKNPNIDYASLVSALKARGVRFEVCEITLRNRNIAKDKFIMDAEFTPSGVVRIGQLQARDKYAYIKP